MYIEEHYFDKFRKVTIVKVEDDEILILVDLYPCNMGYIDPQNVIHRVAIDDIEILVKPLKLENFVYFNRAEIEILCIRSKGACQYVSLRLYTSYHILTQFKSKLQEVLHKIVNSIEEC